MPTVLAALGATTCDDLLSQASRLLRQARPKLPQSSWPHLIAGVTLAGDRLMAARLARVARSVCPGLRLLRSGVHVTVPVPDNLLQVLKTDLRKCLRLLPGGLRKPVHTIAVQTSSVRWGKSPFAEGVLAPPLPELESYGPCSCLGLSGPRHAGHLLTRLARDPLLPSFGCAMWR